MRINVTQRDIQFGRTQDSQSCPIARAIRRHRGIIAVKVGTDDCVLYWRTTRLDLRNCRMVALPKPARHFIKQFDRLARRPHAKPPAPLTFVLENPAHA